MKTIVIFGGSGFIGSYIVRRLAKLGFRVIVPTSNLTRVLKLKIYGDVGQVVGIKLDLLNKIKIRKILINADFVINLKTIWTENKKITFENNIYNFNKIIVDLVFELKIKKYIFFSGVGAKLKSLSKRTRCIANSEKYIKENLFDYVIIRPSIVIGNGDKFISKLIPIFKYSFLIPIFGSGNSKIQPIYVDDVAKAAEKLIINNSNKSNIYELGGNKTFTYKNLYKFLINELKINRLLITIPFIIAHIIVFFMEKLSIDLITKEQLLLFKEDNIVDVKAQKIQDLSIEVSDIELVIKKIISIK